MSFYDYNKGNMNVCNECGEVSLWLDEYAGWCRDCLRDLREYVEEMEG